MMKDTTKILSANINLMNNLFEELFYYSIRMTEISEIACRRLLMN